MKSTKHTSFIPMTPEALPKQRLNEVVRLPEKPADLNIYIQWIDGIGSKKYPREHQESSLLCAVSNGPGHQ